MDFVSHNETLHGQADFLTVELVRNLTHPDVLSYFGCLPKGASSCTDLFEQFIDMPTWRCDGETNMWDGGSWVGHLLPGLAFLVWATHWMIGVFHVYFESQVRNQPYHSRACYSLPGLPASWRIEAVLKILAAPIAISAELYLAHCSSGTCKFRNLYCPHKDYSGSAHTAWSLANVREGHFDGGHVNNWQHASMYPAFFVSGLVDLMTPATEAPTGVQQVYLGLSFVVEAMLMGLHKKHTPLDRIVHECLFYAMMATAVFSLLEVVWPRSFAMSCGRVASAYLQAIWFLVAARIIFEGRPAWDVGGPGKSPWKNDIAPAMYCPLIFAAIAVFIPLILLLVWSTMYLLYRPRLTAVTAVTAARHSIRETVSSDASDSEADAYGVLETDDWGQKSLHDMAGSGGHGNHSFIAMKV